MKVWLLLFCLSGLSVVQLTAETTDEKMTRINLEMESLFKDLAAIPDATVRENAHRKLHEYVRAWASMGFMGVVHGSDELQSETTESYLIDTVYDAFAAEQMHYERSLLQTTADPKTVTALILRRSDDLCRMFPLSQPFRQTEAVAFTTIMMRAYRYNADSVRQQLMKGLERWQGELRLPALVMLAADGNKSAQKELAPLNPGEVRTLMLLVTSLRKYQEGVKPPVR